MALPFDVDDATPLLGMDPDMGVARNKESDHHRVLRVFGVGWVVLLSMAVYRRVATTPPTSTLHPEVQMVDADGVRYTQLTPRSQYTLPEDFFALGEAQGGPLH
jgi:hypothetical protein